MAKWDKSVDMAALHFTCYDVLGLQDAIRIHFAVPDPSVEGFYRREGQRHFIWVNPDMTPGEMSKTLHHELEHARQCEQEFDGDGIAFHEWEDRAKYEEQAQRAELRDHSIRLVTVKRQPRRFRWPWTRIKA